VVELMDLPIPDGLAKKPKEPQLTGRRKTSSTIDIGNGRKLKLKLFQI